MADHTQGDGGRENSTELMEILPVIRWFCAFLPLPPSWLHWPTILLVVLLVEHVLLQHCLKLTSAPITSNNYKRLLICCGVCKMTTTKTKGTNLRRSRNSSRILTTEPAQWVTCWNLRSSTWQYKESMEHPLLSRWQAPTKPFLFSIMLLN